MKVLDDKNFSAQEVKAFSFLYEQLLKPYRFKGAIQSESFYISNVKEAVNLLPKKQIKNIELYINNKAFDEYFLSKALFRLRTTKFRAIYDPQFIKKLQRATDYQLYEPSVVLSFIRLYDSFSGCTCNDTIQKEFSIAKIKADISELTPFMLQVLTLNFGLENGLPIPIKKVAKKLDVPVEKCKDTVKCSLTLLKQRS